jgi:hypothetical protein
MAEFTSEQMQAILEARAKLQAEPQRIRTMAQGATLGFADEIEALVRSAVPNGPQYEDVRNEIRAKLSAYKQQNPKAALTYELAGALAPSLAMMATGVGAPSGAASLSRIVGTGALEGGLYGYGASESPESAGQETIVGGATGAIAGPALQLGLRGGADVASKLINFLREKIGEKPATAVQAELQRLQEQTGKSVEEIIADLQSGRLMSDNRTLMIALKNIVSEGGESGRSVVERTQARAGETADIAMRGLQRELAPNMDENVIRSMRQTDEQLKAAEREAYGSVFGANQFVPESVANEMLRAAQAMPDLAEEIMTRYKAEGRIVPPFKVADNGELQFVRAPSLEDAEIMRRTLKDRADLFYRSGQGTMGEVVSQIEKNLRRNIDELSPQLQAVRQTAAQTRTGRDAFEAGRKALSMNVDELELLMESFTSEASKAFRAGLMHAIRNKVPRQGTTLKNLANEDVQFGQVLRTALSDRDVSQLTRQLELAGETADVAKGIPTTAGSPTAPLTQERARAGMRGSMQDVGRVMSGDPTIVVDMLDRLLKRDRPTLTDQQRMQVVEVLFSRDPEMVRRALTNETPMSELAAMAGQVADALVSGGRTAGTIQATQESTGLLPNVEGK